MPDIVTRYSTTKLLNSIEPDRTFWRFWDFSNDFRGLSHAMVGLVW